MKARWNSNSKINRDLTEYKKNRQKRKKKHLQIIVTKSKMTQNIGKVIKENAISRCFATYV